MVTLLIKIYFSFVVCLSFMTIAYSQTPTPSALPTPPIDENEEIIKVDTGLIQTGVTVLDKNGRFIEGLKLADFELTVDGKPFPITFFELKTPLSNSKPVKKSGNQTQEKLPSASQPIQPQNITRNIVFFVDDVHLSQESTIRSKRVISKFIENDLQFGDNVAIVTPSGKVGFLQQFTDNKDVLKAALARIVYNRNFSATDRMSPPMSEYEAQLVVEGDIEIIEFFVSLDPISGDEESKKERVRMRARQVLAITNEISRQTFSALEKTIRASSEIAGRKMFFLFSDGFVPNLGDSNYSLLMQRVADAASRSNSVIYSIHTRGLESGLPEEGSTANNPRLATRVQSGERFDSKVGLLDFANNTGGDLIQNTNDIQTGFEKSLETGSVYYLLAWETDESTASQSSKTSPVAKKIDIKIKNRPELSVKFQKGYFSGNPNEVANVKTSSPPKKNTNTQNIEPPLSPVEKDLRTALFKRILTQDLPTLVEINYLDLPATGPTVSTTIEIDKNALAYNNESKDSQSVDLLGVIYNSEGKVEESFRKIISVNKNSLPENSKITFNHQAKTKPGLYQIRVATRDSKSGRIGSANKWIQIPDLAKQKITLSSLILGEVVNGSASNVNETIEGTGIRANVGKSFRKTSRIRYLVFIYNATKETPSPDVSIQTKVLQNSKTVLETPFRPISSQGQDPLRLAYLAEIPLGGLEVGRYLLEVSVKDNKNNSTSIQKIEFNVQN